MKSLYERLKSAGCDLDSHESDLYVKDTPEARKIIRQYKQEAGILGDGLGIRRAVSQSDRWLDVDRSALLL